MRFLGGFLKFLAILILLAATAGCTAVAVMNADPDLYWAMGAVWGVILLFVLHILGTGIALCEVAKLRKKLAHYEYRPEKADADTYATANTSSDDTDRYTGHYTAYRARKSSRKWIIAVIIVILVIAVIAAGFLLFRSNLLPMQKQPTPQQIYIPETIALPEEVPAVTPEPIVIAPPEVPAETVPETTAPMPSLSLGNAASTDFVEMRFENCVVKENIKLSVTTGHVTRTTGPDPLAGQQYICLTGKIKNTHTSALPVYDFFIGKFDIDGYSYTVRANDCDILTPDGQLVSSIDPLIEYNFRIYTPIPNELANNHDSCSFTFGFYDLFDNRELASSAAFSENPIAECPHQYAITIK